MRDAKDEGQSVAADRPSGITALPDRIERYGNAKAQGVRFASYLETFDAGSFNPFKLRVASKLQSCGSYLLFRHWIDYDEVRLHAAYFCKQHLVCPFCAIRRGSKMLEAYHERYAVLRQAQPELVPFLVTFTVKDGESLGERYLHLRSAWRALCKRRQGTRQATEWAKALGGVASFEVKRGRGSGLWHPHLHCVAMVDQAHPIDRVALAAEWLQLTGDSHILDVRPIDIDNPVGGFAEVFKYALKFSDMAPADTWAAFRLLRGSRLVEPFGCFRGVQADQGGLDAPLDGRYVEMLYRFVGTGYAFRGEVSQGVELGQVRARPAALGSGGAQPPG